MGDCCYCGKSAGFLKNVHKECKEKYIAGSERIVSLVRSVGSKGLDVKNVAEQIDQIAHNSFIDLDCKKKLVVSGWEKAVEDAFEDNILTEEEEEILASIKDYFKLTQDDLDDNGALTKLVKGAILREVMNGSIPERININFTLPFNFQKGEKPIWVFQDVDYLERRVRREYVGGMRGVSFRVAKGVYFRTGGFRGQRIDKTELVHTDNGILAITNKHVSFAGNVKSFRIKYDKIVSFEPYSDGIGLQRDAQTAKPQIFITGDGWFTYNLIVNVARL